MSFSYSGYLLSEKIHQVPTKGQELHAGLTAEPQGEPHILFLLLFIYLSRGIQFSRASLNGALTKHKNKDIETLKLDNQLS